MADEKKYSHKEIAVNCFNAVWDIMDKDSRLPEDVTEMLHLAHTSLWHWTKVADHTPENLSVGYWQLSRAYAVAEEFENALKYAEICIDMSGDDSVGPFYKSYALEAAARACLGLGRSKEGRSYLESVLALAGDIPKDEFDMLKPDLDELEEKLKSHS